MGYGILEFISGLLLKVIPSPELWGMLLFIVFAAYMTFRKFPMSAGGHIGFILIISLAGIGGVFGLLQTFMYAISGGVFLLGLFSFMSKS